MKVLINNNKYKNCEIIIDDEDYEKIKNKSILIEKNNMGILVARIKIDGRRLMLHTYLTNGSIKNIRHMNDNLLDFRKDNLVSFKEYKKVHRKFTPNEIQIKNKFAFIIIESLKYGIKKVRIDKEDIEKVLNYRWYIVKDYNTFYCVSATKERIYLHNYIMNNVNKEYIIDHKDGNGLHNNKDNLRLVNSELNNKNRALSKRNKSGVTGVFKYDDKYIVSWFKDKKHKTKSFYISDYENEEEAFKDAVKYRKKKEKENNYFTRKRILYINKI